MNVLFWGWCDFPISFPGRDMSRNVWNRSKKVLWSVQGPYQTIWGPPVPNVTHSGWWPYTVTSSIDRILHQFLTVTDLYLITDFDFLPNYARYPYNICTGCGTPTEDATPPNTWSCPTLGLACVLISRPIPLERVWFQDFWVSNIPRYFSFALLRFTNCSLVVIIFQK